MRRILLAEKDLKAAKTQKALLINKGGVEVTIVQTAQEALEMMNAQSFDLLLADLDLPKGGGDALCSTVKEKGWKTFVILACSGHLPDLKKCGRCGADAYMETPVDPVDLDMRTDRILQVTNWRAPRVLVKVTVDGVFGLEDFFCTSRNLSASGILLETDKSLARGDTIKCSFFLPDMDRIEADCSVVRVDKPSEGVHFYGAEFVQLDANQTELVNTFILREREAGNII
jgi:DNA-binding response OmpR family regulator